LKNTDNNIEPYITVPFTPMRKVIASRMLEATQSIPHFRLVREIDIDNLLKLRKQINKSKNDLNVSINDFVVRASALSLVDNPKVNSQIFENKVHQFSNADIAVVVAVDGGLLTPVIRSANEMSVTEIAAAMRDLTLRAARGKLKMPEISGGTFSISNIGKYSVDQFDAIINSPQVGILAVGSAMEKAVVVDCRIVVRTIMRVSLSLDHRAVDGIDGAIFLDALGKLMEAPELLLELEAA